MQPSSGIESPVHMPSAQSSMSTAEAAAELHQLRFRVSLTPDEQWRTLEARDRFVLLWLTSSLCIFLNISTFFMYMHLRRRRCVQWGFTRRPFIYQDFERMGRRRFPRKSRWRHYRNMSGHVSREGITSQTSRTPGNFSKNYIVSL